MIAHIFNSSIVSGPELLVLPALLKLGEPTCVVFLLETRVTAASRCPVEYARKLGHHVETVTVRSRWDRAAFLELRGILERLKVRIAHAHDVKASLYLYQAKNRGTELPIGLVSTHHGVACRKGKNRIYEEYYVRHVLPHYDLVLSVCSRDRVSIARRGVRDEKILVHLNGAKRAWVSSGDRATLSENIRSEWRSRFPRIPPSKDAVFLGAVARLSPEKRHDRMLKVLQTMRRTQAEGKTCVLLCFGIGPEEERLRKMAVRLGVHDAVFWMGYSNTVGDEMAAFDIILSLSDGEGLPVNLLEAAWAGTPVLATKVGGIPDLISSPAFGYLVDGDNSDEEIASVLRNLVMDPNGMKSVGEASQKNVAANFSEKVWIQNLREAYKKVSSQLVALQV